MRGRRTGELALMGVLSALLFAGQVALAAIPNVEIVSLLVILYTLALGRKVFLVIYTFVLLEGVFYGFGLWWINYLYVWAALALAVLPFRKKDSALFFAVLSGFFGLFFGALCALPYGLAGGPAAAFAYWISGIPFDLVHCGGNFAVCLAFYRPLKFVIEKAFTNWE